MVGGAVGGAVLNGGAVTTGAAVVAGACVLCVLCVGAVVAVALVLDDVTAVVAVPPDFTVVVVGLVVVLVLGLVVVLVVVLVPLLLPAGPLGLPAESSVYLVFKHAPGCTGAIPIVAAR